jgi:hypothetical protein
MSYTSTVYQYGEHEIDFSKLPDGVVTTALKRAFSHVLSNEVKSKSGTVTAKMIADGSLSAEDLDAKREELETQYRNEFIAAFYDGTWGSGTRGTAGPRIDSLEAEYQRLLAKTVRAYLSGNKKIGYDKETKTWFWTLADGTRQTRTIEEAIEGYQSKMKPAEEQALREAAAETVAAKKRAAEASKARAGDEEEMAI